MKILFVSEYFYPKITGGGEVNLQQVAQSLVGSNVQVAVITSHFENLPVFEMINNIEVYRSLKTGNSASSFFSNLKRSIIFPRSVEKEVELFAKKWNPDIIHFIGNSIIAAPYLKKLGIPLVSTMEGYSALCPKGDRLYCGKTECPYICSFSKFLPCQMKSTTIGKMKNSWYLCYNPFSLFYTYIYSKKMHKALSYCHLIAISQCLKELLSLHGQESIIIPNALDLEPFKKYSQTSANDKKRKNLSQKPQILYLGSLTPSKGPQILLEALEHLSCHCDIYGEGILKEELQQLVSSQKLDVEIHSPIPSEQIPKLYSFYDIVVFPSIWPEPFGRIAIEGLASGKIVIGSNIGGIKETLEDQGILVSPGDARALRNAIIEVIENKHYLRYDKVNFEPLEKYSKETISKKFILAYQSIIRKKV